MSNIVVRKLAVPLGASSEAALLFPAMVKQIVTTFYNIFFEDCPQCFLAMSYNPGHFSVRTFEAGASSPACDEESSLLDVLVSTGLTEKHLYNIFGILGSCSEGSIDVATKTITIESQSFNYETFEKL